jgi:hypothetical protein
MVESTIFYFSNFILLNEDHQLAGMELSMFGVANKRDNIDTICGKYGATDTMKGEVL